MTNSAPPSASHPTHLRLSAPPANPKLESLCSAGYLDVSPAKKSASGKKKKKKTLTGVDAGKPSPKAAGAATAGAGIQKKKKKKKGSSPIA